MSRKKKIFCESCGQNVEYDTYSNNVKLTVKGITFTYKEIHACCPNCGEDIIVPFLENENHLAKEHAYHEAKNFRKLKEEI